VQFVEFSVYSYKSSPSSRYHFCLTSVAMVRSMDASRKIIDNQPQEWCSDVFRYVLFTYNFNCTVVILKLPCRYRFVYWCTTCFGHNHLNSVPFVLFISYPGSWLRISSKVIYTVKFLISYRSVPTQKHRYLITERWQFCISEEQPAPVSPISLFCYYLVVTCLHLNCWNFEISLLDMKVNPFVRCQCVLEELSAVLLIVLK